MDRPCEPTMFEPENDIERALVRAATEPVERAGFVRALMEAQIFVVLIAENGSIVPGPDGKATVTEGATLRMASAQRGEDKLLPFFTAPSRAQAWFKGEHIIAPETTRGLFSRAPDLPYVLNPGCEYGKEFTRDEVKRLLAGRFDSGQAETLMTPEQVLLAQPKAKPEALIAALGRELGALESVSGAWLTLAHRQSHAEPTWMLGVKHDGNWNDVRAAIGRAVTGNVLEGRMLDAMPIDGSGFSEKLRSGIPLIAAKRGLFSRLFK